MHATAPRAVPQLQAQVLAAIAALAALGLANQQHLVDLDAVAQLVQEHGLKVETAADGTRRACVAGARRGCACA